MSRAEEDASCECFELIELIAPIELIELLELIELIVCPQDGVTSQRVV